MKTKIFILILTLLLIACAAEPEAPADEPEVEEVIVEPEPESEPVIQNKEVLILESAFDQEEIIIKTGDTVTFINKFSEDGRKIYQRGGGLISPVLAPDEKFDYVFEESGEFEIMVAGISNIKLKVIVE